MATHEVLIDRWVPPSLNDLLKRGVRAQIRAKAAAVEVVYFEALRAGVPPAAGRRSVRLEVRGWPSGGRLPDPDNLWKCVLDGLVARGALRDDSPRWCELAGVEVSRGDPRTRIVLEDLEG